MTLPSQSPSISAAKELDPLLPSWAELAISVGGLLLLAALAILILVLVLRRRRDQ